MKVFKFGGASVKNATAIKNAVQITQSYKGPLIVVVSAMGKTTNSLEELWSAFVKRDQKTISKSLNKLVEFHNQLLVELFQEQSSSAKLFNESLSKLSNYLEKEPSENMAYEYDQIVSYGELWSTIIFSGALAAYKVNAKWMDARKIIRTTNHFQEARVDWPKTKDLVKSTILSAFEKDMGLKCVVTQGFIGHANSGKTTTLGREGSDFSAAILAWATSAQQVLIWKDVPGLLNADPKEFENTIKIDRISYKEAIELSYFGASVIHPKTLKPLQNSNIPLLIKSFVDPKAEGTIIDSDESADYQQASYIYKRNQLLISISPKDFSFILEDHISEIFSVFSLTGVKVHLMQNSALSFSVCATMKKTMLKGLIDNLSEKFNVKYNEDVDLLTIRHYKDHVFPEKLKTKKVLIKQRSRSTLRYVLR
ncbi:MAG: aspartate kinase [Flavobacteriales bacterium]|nr:aspartate kinase [Flavobacteriales bacterium]|tara:strand:+ start:2296 stop:3564 length:1269 start_codon:yes stop_codon:yes gene_type:complete